MVGGRLWGESVAALAPETTVLLNADDPLVAGLPSLTSGPTVLTYGIDDESVGSPTLPHAADARLCPRCGGALRYSLVFYGHLGHYQCTNCAFARPPPRVVSTAIGLLGADGPNLPHTTPARVM